MSVFTVLCWTSSELRTQHEATLLYIFWFAKLSEGWTKLSFREKIELGTKLTEMMAGENLPFGTKLASGQNYRFKGSGQNWRFGTKFTFS